MMSIISIKQFKFKSLILGVSAFTTLTLTLFVAYLSAQIAYNEMSHSAYQQGVQITKNLTNESLVPLLYDNEQGANDLISTFIDLEQITNIKIYHNSNKLLSEGVESQHIPMSYPKVNLDTPFKIKETSGFWYFSALVVNQSSDEEQSENYFGLENKVEVVELGYVNVAVSKTNIIISKKNIFIQDFLVSLIAGFILLTATYFILVRLTKPLEELSELMELGRTGIYPEVTIIEGTKEICEMSETFNTMLFAIREREQNLSLTLDSIGDAVIATDSKGNVNRMNPVAEQLTGWSFSEAKGLPLKQIFFIVDASTREEIENPIEKVLSTGETIYLSNHTTLISKYGKEFQIADSAAPIIDNDNAILGMVLIFNDVTEQYHLREQISSQKKRLQGIFDDMQSMVALLDIDGRLTFINNTPLKLMNLTHPEVLGVKFWDLDFIKYDSTVQTYVNESCINAAKGQKSLRDIPLKAPDGLYWIEFSIHPIIDETGVVTQLVVEGRDINTRKEQEEALRRSQKMEAIGQLAGGIAHDFNNQLGIVIGYMDILKDSLTNEQQLNWINISTEATLRSIDLTRQLLTFSRRKSSEKSAVNVNQSLTEMKTLITRTVTPEVDVLYYLSEDTAIIEVDSGGFKDAILNIVINARDVMPRGGQLVFETSNIDTSDLVLGNKSDMVPGKYVLITISDTGFGMDKETLEHIFEPFFTTKEEGKGTGLGLAMVYSFVNQFKGGIFFYSEVDIGTTIRIYLPQSETETRKKQSPKKSPIILPRGYERILIVDDEASLLDLAEQYLVELGYSVVKASNASSAMEILSRDQSIDLIFSDVVMPGEMDGFDLAERAQQEYPKVKVLLTSGFTSKVKSHPVDQKFKAELLSKPYRKAELAKVVRSMLDG